MVFFAKRKMQKAIRNHDLVRVRELLDDGVDPNMTFGKEDYAPLQLAASEGLRDMSALLLDRGAKVDVTDKNGNTALHFAAQAGSEDTVSLLLDRGASINAMGKESGTALHQAALSGAYGVAVLLLKKKADANLMTENGGTAYGWASAQGHVDLARAILPYMKKASELTQVPLPPPRPATRDAWSLQSESVVAHVSVYDKLGYRLTDIFNFSARERVRIYHNLNTKVDAAPEAKSFDDISDKTPIEEALTHLRRLGGKADDAAIRSLPLHKPTLLPPPGPEPQL